MSMENCKKCNQNIDTDYNVDHDVDCAEQTKPSIIQITTITEEWVWWNYNNSNPIGDIKKVLQEFGVTIHEVKFECSKILYYELFDHPDIREISSWRHIIFDNLIIRKDWEDQIVIKKGEEPIAIFKFLR